MRVGCAALAELGAQTINIPQECIECQAPAFRLVPDWYRSVWNVVQLGIKLLRLLVLLLLLLVLLLLLLLRWRQPSWLCLVWRLGLYLLRV